MVIEGHLTRHRYVVISYVRAGIMRSPGTNSTWDFWALRRPSESTSVVAWRPRHRMMTKQGEQLIVEPPAPSAAAAASPLVCLRLGGSTNPHLLRSSLLTIRPSSKGKLILKPIFVPRRHQFLACIGRHCLRSLVYFTSEKDGHRAACSTRIYYAC